MEVPRLRKKYISMIVQCADLNVTLSSVCPCTTAWHMEGSLRCCNEIIVIYTWKWYFSRERARGNARAVDRDGHSVAARLEPRQRQFPGTAVLRQRGRYSLARPRCSCDADTMVSEHDVARGKGPKACVKSGRWQVSVIEREACACLARRFPDLIAYGGTTEHFVI